MKTETFVKQQINKFESNRHTIVRGLGLTTEQYNELQFEFGCKYLEDQYPKNTEFEKYYEKYAYSKYYWSWWKLEWALWEEDFLLFVRNHNYPLTMKTYKLDYMHPRTVTRIDSSFHNNFLKNFDRQV